MKKYVEPFPKKKNMIIPKITDKKNKNAANNKPAVREKVEIEYSITFYVLFGYFISLYSI